MGLLLTHHHNAVECAALLDHHELPGPTEPAVPFDGAAAKRVEQRRRVVMDDGAHPLDCRIGAVDTGHMSAIAERQLRLGGARMVNLLDRAGPVVRRFGGPCSASWQREQAPRILS